MNALRELAPEDLDAFVHILANAYPGMQIVSPEDMDRLKQRLLDYDQNVPSTALYGLFREGQLLGGMRFHDFTMNLLGTWIAAGGVGQVAVALPHKKEHVAKEMMEFFLRHYRERGVSMTLLYPFRPDFYKRMGFGYGRKVDQYRVRPASLPKGLTKEHVRYLDEADTAAVLDCHTRFVHRTHGMIERSEYEMSRMIKSPRTRTVGYERNGQIEGYLIFTFDHGENWLLNDIHIREFIYESHTALSELFTFLHTQADQIRQIVFNLQDEFFYYTFLDPRNGSPTLIPDVYHESNIQGVGLMYRVIDTPRIFQMLWGHNFGRQTCKLKLTIEDSFLPENAGSTYIYFDEGRARLLDHGDYDVEVRMEIAEFSSMLVGAVNFGRLYQYGLADISDQAYFGTVEQIFAVADKPICMTSF